MRRFGLLSSEKQWRSLAVLLRAFRLGASRAAGLSLRS